MVNYLRGQIAKMANVSVETLRYYEKNQLIPVPERTKSGYRLYSEEILKRIEFIKNVKECGLTIPEIREFFVMVDRGSINIVKISSYIDKKIADIDSKIAKLIKTRAMLEEFNQNLQQEKICPALQKFLSQIKLE
jgi:MerR family transcriptional regulator, Zn(II)-responsive regulator of zntA